MSSRIPISELEFSYSRSSGPGGQNVNKVSSKCILRWDFLSSPSLSEEVRARFLERFANRLTKDGCIVITSDRFRDQKKNYNDCIEKLESMLQAVIYPPKPRTKTKPTKASRKRRLENKKIHSQKKSMRRKDY